MTVAGDIELLLRKERGEILEHHPVAKLLRIESVDHLYLDEREILFAVFGRTYLARNGIALVETESAYLRGRHIDVVRRVEVVVVG